MWKLGTFMNLGGLLVTALVSSTSYASDQFSRPLNNEPDFLRNNNDRDHDNPSTLTPFENNVSPPSSSILPAPQPPSPPPIPQRRVQK